MSTNPFKMICADCKSPWRDGDRFCWNCGSANFADNPDYQQPIAPPAFTVPPRPVRAATDSDSADESLYLFISLAAGLFAAGVVYFPSKDTIENIGLIALFTGAIVAANCWIVCLIIMTKSKVDRLTESNRRIEQLLIDQSRR